MSYLIKICFFRKPAPRPIITCAFPELRNLGAAYGFTPIFELRKLDRDIHLARPIQSLSIIHLRNRPLHLISSHLTSSRTQARILKRFKRRENMTGTKLLPGQASLPTPNSTNSFWHSQPSKILLGHRTTESLPIEADLVIVGSGLSGTSAAHFLREDEAGKNLKVVMLEAREACWGATGRVSPRLIFGDNNCNKERKKI